MFLFTELEKNQPKDNFLQSDEMAFYLENRGLIEQIDAFSYYLKAEDPFKIIRANVIIRSLINKMKIQDYFEAKAKKESNNFKDLTELLQTLPYLEKKGERIYLPILPLSINKLLLEEPGKFLTDPYKGLFKAIEALIVDPFDTYGSDLLNSLFTKLIMVDRNDEFTAFYDYDAERIYIVNEQCRLDVNICLFDKYFKHPNKNHMISRIIPLISAYKDGDKKQLETILVENKLISSYLIHKIRSEEIAFLNKAYKK